MPVRSAPDSGKSVKCPMPGVVVSVAVTEGQEVKSGETLAVVEAMKMENILRAERDGTVKSIHVKPGEVLAVDQTMLEFA
jgi:propionyl-CoA carboxylase alpha chain